VDLIHVNVMLSAGHRVAVMCGIHGWIDGIDGDALSDEGFSCWTAVFYFDDKRVAVAGA